QSDQPQRVAVARKSVAEARARPIGVDDRAAQYELRTGRGVALGRVDLAKNVRLPELICGRGREVFARTEVVRVDGLESVSGFGPMVGGGAIRHEWDDAEPEVSLIFLRALILEVRDRDDERKRDRRSLRL